MAGWVLLAGALAVAVPAGLLGALLQGRRIPLLQQQVQDALLRDSAREHEHERLQTDLHWLEQELDEARELLRRQHEQDKQHVQRYHEAEKQLEAMRARYQLLSKQAAQWQAQLQQEARLREELQEGKQALATEHAELKTSLQAREEHFAQQLQQLSENRQQLTREFENLANRIFAEKEQRFSQSSQAGIDSLLKPFREQIESFQRRVNEVHDATQQGNVRLNAEIGRVLEAGLQMSADASNLVAALKGDAQQRGAWGEAQLRRTLELGGLVEGDHFIEQGSFRDGEGRLKQTDFLICLPDDKHLVIDSKVTLNAYARLVEADSQEGRQQALAEHVRAVRRHIDDLAGKDYSGLPALNSPGLVLMFMPVEPAFIEALRHDPALYDYGYRKNIVLVSHTTLIPVLRTVSNLWMMEHSQQEAREISDRAGELYNQVCLVAERLQRLGNTLGSVSNHYNGVVTALAGQQGLQGKVERFARLSARVSRSMPELETRHLEFETGRLQLAADPVTTEQTASTGPEPL